MEFVTQLFSTALPLLAITFLAWYLYVSLWLRPKKLEHFLRNQGFRGNPYHPINGDLAEITEITQSAISKPMPSLSHDLIPRLVPAVQQTVRQHGANSFMWYGRNPKLNISNVEMIKEVFAKYNVFRKQPLGKPSSFGLVLRDGEDWAKVRRIINPAFHVEKLKMMLPLMEVSVDEMLCTWEKMFQTKESIEVDVYSCLSSMAGDVIARTAFGSSYEEGKSLFEFEEESLILKFQTMRSMNYHIPGWRYLPTKMNRKIKELDHKTEELMMNLIDNKKRALERGNDTSKADLLSVMLESNQKDIEDHGSGISSDELVGECRLFLLAGKDTTASLLTWALVLLSQHQDWQSKARAEVLQHFGKDRNPTFEGLNSLKMVNMILHETLRFYPPVPCLSRIIGEDCKLKSFSLLHGMEINIPTILVHRDPEIWGDDANEFNPSRFAKGVSNAANVSGSFLPFGGGPRICIGQNFALIEAKLALAKILHQFSFQMSPTYVHAPIPIVGVVPQFGAPLILHKI